MEGKPIFESTAQAVEVLWEVTIRLAGLLGWVVVALAHTVLLLAALLAMWATQTTPAEVASAAQQFLQTWPAAALGAAGVSALSVAAGYWWLMKRLHRATGGLIAAAVLPKPRR